MRCSRSSSRRGRPKWVSSSSQVVGMANGQLDRRRPALPERCAERPLEAAPQRELHQLALEVTAALHKVCGGRHQWTPIGLDLAPSVLDFSHAPSVAGTADTIASSRRAATHRPAGALGRRRGCTPSAMVCSTTWYVVYWRPRRVSILEGETVASATYSHVPRSGWRGAISARRICGRLISPGSIMLGPPRLPVGWSGSAADGKSSGSRASAVRV